MINNDYIVSVEGIKNFESSVQNFKFPQAYLKIVKLGMADLDHWFLLSDNLIQDRSRSLKRRYGRELIPFAGRYDCDDIACFEIGFDNRVFIVHDFASVGWERRQEYDNFGEWLLEAVRELIDTPYEEDEE